MMLKNVGFENKFLVVCQRFELSLSFIEVSLQKESTTQKLLVPPSLLSFVRHLPAFVFSLHASPSQVVGRGLFTLSAALS